MKLLHVYRNEPNEEVKKLVQILNEGNEAMEFKLYEAQEDADYDELIQMIFEADKTISWW